MTSLAEKDIFLDALEYETKEGRERFLDYTCKNNVELRRNIEKLLEAHQLPNPLLDHLQETSIAVKKELQKFSSPENNMDTCIFALDTQIAHNYQNGEMIGVYKLLKKLGEGGFGEVFIAEQLKPVHRQVALKLLHTRMNSREMVARFEAEQQALAMMDHPHIAKVFDAGTTAHGQPYFVMELVKGVTITEYCQNHQLTHKQKLKLFIDICHAVQHAHQKGVIHRDIKPSNILVSEEDGQPIIKVIDFGIAKPVSEPLTDKTVYTRYAQLIGTPMYMSPEQAELGNNQVDIRCDIYSLGVVLYELLTGTPPISEERFQTATFDELRKMIREEEPPRPSSRLLDQINSGIKTHVKQQSQLIEIMNLRGELDWVVMKALDKDRTRRYQTVREFAQDVERYLEQQPVHAKPPTVYYRLSKFIQRNKVIFLATTAVFLALLTGTVISTWQAYRAIQAYNETDKLRKEAIDSAEKLKDANILLDSARANLDEQRFDLAWSQYSKAIELKPDHYLTWSGRGSLLARLGTWNKAAQDYREALKLGATANNPGWWGVAALFAYSGDDESFQQICSNMEQHAKASRDEGARVFTMRSLGMKSMKPELAIEMIKQFQEIMQQNEFSQQGNSPLPGGTYRENSNRDDRNRLPPLSTVNHDGFQDKVPPGNFKLPVSPDNLAPPDFFIGIPQMKGMPPEIRAYVQGLLFYRAGRFQDSVQILEQANPEYSQFKPAALLYPLLAMNYYQLGKKKVAEEYYELSSRQIKEWLQLAIDNPPGVLPIPWFDLIEYCLLQRETDILFQRDQQSIRKFTEQLEQKISGITVNAHSLHSPPAISRSTP